MAFCSGSDWSRPGWSGMAVSFVTMTKPRPTVSTMIVIKICIEGGRLETKAGELGGEGVTGHQVIPRLFRLIVQIRPIQRLELKQLGRLNCIMVNQQK